MSATNGTTSGKREQKARDHSDDGPAQPKGQADTDATVKKKFLLTCAVFAVQARNEGRWLEFLSHVFSRYWLLWPEPMQKSPEELRARVESSKTVRSSAVWSLLNFTHPYLLPTSNLERQKRAAMGRVVHGPADVQPCYPLGEPACAQTGRL